MSSTLVQAVGFIGLIFLILSFQMKNRKGILILMAAGQIIFMFHFILLGAWTAAGMNIVGTARTLVFRSREDKKWAGWKFWPYIFILLFATAGLLARESWLGVLPVIAMTVSRIFLFS